MSVLTNRVIQDRFGNEINVNEWCLVSYAFANVLFLYKGFVENVHYPIKGFQVWNPFSYNEVNGQVEPNFNFLRIDKSCIAAGKKRIIKCTNAFELIGRFENSLEVLESLPLKSYYKNG